MITTVGVLLGITALICLLGGLNIMLKGAMYFLPEGTPVQHVLDNLVRFLAGIYFSGGFLFAYAAWHITVLGDIVYLLGLMVMFSGLGRLYSRYKTGSAGRYFDWIMVVEIVLGLSIIILKQVAG